MLGPAQPLRIGARIERSPAPRSRTRPARGSDTRAGPRRSRATAHQPALAPHHHPLDLGRRRADQGDPSAPRRSARQLAHPFRPGPRLAEAAPGQHQPGPPVARRAAAARHAPRPATGLSASGSAARVSRRSTQRRASGSAPGERLDRADRSISAFISASSPAARLERVELAQQCRGDKLLLARRALAAAGRAARRPGCPRDI